MGNKFPVRQIRGGIDRYTWECKERGNGKVVGVIDPQNVRIRVPSFRFN
jgi:hypothetical protein